MLTLDTPSLGRIGAGLGCGAISVIGPNRCGLVEVARVTRWLAGESAGQCGPCGHGLPAIAGAVEALVAGDRRHPEDQLRRWLGMVEGRGACHHPDGVVRFVRSALAAFADHVEQHRRRGPCRPAPPLLPTPRPVGGRRSSREPATSRRPVMRPHLEVDPIACDGHGLCAELLPELIRLDDWGYPMLDPGPIPPGLEAHVRRAVAACPTLALRVRDRPAPRPGTDRQRAG